MYNLKVIEDGLIKVYKTDEGNKVVNARDLHEGLGSKQDFSTWAKKRLNECDAIESEDYVSLHKIMERETGATKRIEYILNIDIAKEMAMLEKNKKGKQYRRYFIEVEKKYKNGQSIRLSPMEQLKLQYEVLGDHDKRLENLENNMTIDFGQQKTLCDIAKKIALYALGGIDSPAYSNKSIRNKTFSRIWKDFKDYFTVSSYKDTQKINFDKAKEHLKNWKPQGRLLKEIEDCNSQSKLNTVS